MFWPISIMHVIQPAFFFTKSISSNQKTVTIVGNFTSFQYPMVKTIIGASLHLLTSSCHICLSSDCHSTPFLSTLWCCLPISLSVFLSFCYLVQFLVGLFWHVLCILWHAHTTLHLVSLLWSEDLYETPLRLWLCTSAFVMWSLFEMPRLATYNGVIQYSVCMSNL